jgi:hypothetical protein
MTDVRQLFEYLLIPHLRWSGIVIVGLAVWIAEIEIEGKGEGRDAGRLCGHEQEFLCRGCRNLKIKRKWPTLNEIDRRQ